MSEEEEFVEFEEYEMPKVEGINIVDIVRKYRKVVPYRESFRKNYITFLENKHPKRSRYPLNKYALTLLEIIHDNKIKLKNVEEHNRGELEEEVRSNEEKLQKYYDELEVIFRLKEVYIESGNFSEDKKAELDNEYFNKIEKEGEDLNDIKKYYLAKLEKEDIENLNKLSAGKLSCLELRYLNDFEKMNITQNNEIRFIIKEKEEFKCLNYESKTYKEELKVEYGFILNEDKITLESMEAGKGIDYVSCHFNDIKYNDLISENIEQSYDINDINFIISDILKNGLNSVFLEENKYDLSIASVFLKKFSKNQELVNKVQQFIGKKNPPRKNIELLSLVAARSGNVLLLKFLIMCDYISNDTEKLFELAFASGNVEMIHLVENIAIANKEEAVIGYKALKGACISERLDLIEYLIENFDSINSIFDSSSNVFCREKICEIFSVISNTRIFELLFTKIIDVNSNENIKKIIERAYVEIFEKNESLEALQFIYSLKNIYTRLPVEWYRLDEMLYYTGLEGLSNEKLLFFSIDNLNIQATKFLVNKIGKKINSKIEGRCSSNGLNGTTPLILAIENSDVLLDKSEMIMMTMHGPDPISHCNHYVLERKNKIVEILLSNPEIDTNKKGKCCSLGCRVFCSPIELAIGRKRNEMVKMLCDKGAESKNHFSVIDNDIYNEDDCEEREYFVKHINEKYSNKQKEEIPTINEENQLLELETVINAFGLGLMDEAIKDADIDEEEEEENDKERNIGD